MFSLLSPKPIFSTFGLTSRYHNQDAADRVELAIFDACAFLAEAPGRGHSRPELTARPLRFWTLSRYPNYVIVYRPEKPPLRIVPVMHGKRDIQHILKQ